MSLNVGHEQELSVYNGLKTIVVTRRLPMARPVEYNKQVVLDKVTELFRVKGFQGAKTKELLEVTGLNSTSLFALFSNKKKMYQAALKNYERQLDLNLLCLLQGSERGLIPLEKFFKRAISYMFPRGEFYGCLMSNGLCDKKNIDLESFQIIQNYYQKLQSLIKTHLLAANESGEIFLDEDELSSQVVFLLALFQGLTLRAQCGASRAELMESVDAVLERFSFQSRVPQSRSVRRRNYAALLS